MYLIKSYTLIVRYFGLMEAMGVSGNKTVGESWRPKEPRVHVFRYWTKRGLNRVTSLQCVSNLKDEGRRVFSCDYTEDGNMSLYSS